MPIRSEPRRQRHRAASRGLTLVELIIVITIIGVLMGAIAIGIFAQKKKADKGTAEIMCKNLRTSALSFKSTHPDVDCPSPEQLKAEKEIDSTANLKDPWGQPYKLSCDTDEIVCVSSGPDKKEGTDDDVRVPKLEVEGK
jgi:general secretion pathway protein G